MLKIRLTILNNLTPAKKKLLIVAAVCDFFILSGLLIYFVR